MADRDDTPGSGSPLSDIDSLEFIDEMKSNRSRSQSNASTISDAASDASATPSTSTPRHSDMHPAKRRRTGASAYDHATPQSALMPPLSPTGSISSDSSGSVPTSPSFAHLGPTHPLSTAYAAAQANPDNPDMGDYVQVTRCQWTKCPDPEQGNMDNLVMHINDVHIPPRQKKYFCEWEGCTRKSLPHTSAYALKAHMRSHTKEKPFQCQLPECDRSFTRSDALAKHMRTVHETEALRPSDPVPRGHTGGISAGAQGNTNGTLKRIKLRVGGINSTNNTLVATELPPLPVKGSMAYMDGPLAPKTQAEYADPELSDAVDIDANRFWLPVPESYYPADVYEVMDEYERDLPPSQFYRLLRRQLKWAQQEGDSLTRELAEARTTTDNLHGHVIRRSVSNSAANRDSDKASVDERIGDEIRKEEWSVVEGLLDQLLKGEMLSVVTSASADGMAASQTSSTDNGNGNTDTNGPASDANREAATINAVLNESDPWTLLKTSRGLEDLLR